MKVRTFYVSNKQLFAEYVDWYSAIKVAQEQGIEEPPIPDFIVDSMIKIANRLSYKPNFLNYSFKDELISDALYDCIRFANKFKLSYRVEKSVILQKIGEVEQIPLGTRSLAEISRLRRYVDMRELMTTNNVDFVIKQGNPFNYLTTISNNAFLRRIDKEKTQTYIKGKIMNESLPEDFLDAHCQQDDTEFTNQYVDFLREVGYSEDVVPMCIKRAQRKKEDAEIAKRSLLTFEDE